MRNLLIRLVATAIAGAIEVFARLVTAVRAEWIGVEPGLRAVGLCPCHQCRLHPDQNGAAAANPGAGAAHHGRGRPMICVFCPSHVPALLTLEIEGYAGRGVEWNPRPELDRFPSLD